MLADILIISSKALELSFNSPAKSTDFYINIFIRWYKNCKLQKSFKCVTIYENNVVC